jgi:hypothetical protein
MAYSIELADKVREYLAEIPNLDIEEKPMFNVLNFMVNGKTCVCVSGENLMLRFDPQLQGELAEKNECPRLEIVGIKTHAQPPTPFSRQANAVEIIAIRHVHHAFGEVGVFRQKIFAAI